MTIRVEEMGEHSAEYWTALRARLVHHLETPHGGRGKCCETARANVEKIDAKLRDAGVDVVPGSNQ